MRKHYWDLTWRYFTWDTSMGEVLKRLNKKWKIKYHSENGQS